MLSASGLTRLLDEHLDRAEANLSAGGMQRLGDAPGDRVVVGDAEDERLAPAQQIGRDLRGRAVVVVHGAIVVCSATWSGTIPASERCAPVGSTTSDLTSQAPASLGAVASTDTSTD